MSQALPLADRAQIPASYTVYKIGSEYRAKSWLDGGTDYKGTDAATVIQSALNGLTSGRTWKERVVVKGNITTALELSIPSYTSLDLHAILTYSGPINTSIIKTATNATNIEILGGILDGVNIAQSVGVKILAGGSDILVRETFIKRAANAVSVVSSNNVFVDKVKANNIIGTAFALGTGGVAGGVPTTNSKITNCYLDTSTDDGIIIDLNSSKNYVARNILKNVGRYGIVCDQSPDNLIEDNLIDTPASYGIFITNNTTDGIAQRNIVSRNKIVGGTLQNAILVQGASAVAPLLGVKVFDNFIYDCLLGVEMIFCEDSEVRGNHVELIKQKGIHMNTCKYSTVLNNHIRDTSQATNNTYDQIQIHNSTFCDVIGNDSQETKANKAARGIEESGTSNNNYLSHNNMTGAVTAVIVILGTSTKAKDNPGFNPQGWATTSPAVPATGVDETNTKGYPVLVYITGLGTGISAVGITDNAGTLQSFTRTAEVGDFYRLEPSDKIRLTYTGSPTWKWYGL